MPEWQFDDINALAHFYAKRGTDEVEFDDTNAVSNTHVNSLSEIEIVWHTVHGL